MLSIILFYLSYGLHFDETWIGSQWKGKLSVWDILNHVSLISNFNTSALNPIIWSLVHELRFALIFPAILFLLKFKPFVVVSITSVLYILAGILIARGIEPPLGFNNSYLYTVYYLAAFISGGLLANHSKKALDFYTKQQILRINIYCFSPSSLFICP